MTLDETERLHAAGMASAVLLQIILTERDREIGGWCVCADGLTAFPDRSHGSSRSLSLHPLYVTPKPYRLHRHPDHHSRSLLAQLGLTPKSRRGSGTGEVVDPLDAL